MKAATIVGWSGNGDLADLERSAAAKLSGLDLKTKVASKALILEGGDPVGIARRLAHLPGVAWIAVGFQFNEEAGFLARLDLLAHRYLRKGSTFSLRVKAQESQREEGDLLLEGTGVVLKAVRESRVEEKSPEVVFRALMIRGSGAVGVELRAGPGGVPTSPRTKMTCLVSGGYHSAVVAWRAALSGYTVTLVHSREDDEALRQVARLYAELSHRMDSSGLELILLTGEGAPGDRLGGWLKRAKGEVVCGVHPECRGMATRGRFSAYGSVLSPLLLLSEEEVMKDLHDLGLKLKQGDSEPVLVLSRKRQSYRQKRFGGREADTSAVLDSLLA